MNHVKFQMLPFQRLTREPFHHFFGYYDLQPWSPDGRLHLCHRVGFMDRMPGPCDRAELGMIRVHDGEFIPLAETYAWNFQQGSMLQWNPARPGVEVIFNARIGGAFRAVVKNIETGSERILPRALAAVDSAGRFGLAVNFSRMFDFRPGYGYAGIPDPWAAVAAPEEDGIFLIDLENGSEKKILSLAALGRFYAGSPQATQKLLVNHLTFNTDGTRFVFLLRHLPLPGAGKFAGGWTTATLTAKPDGTDLRELLGWGMASHYHWRDADQLLIWAGAGPQRKNGLWLFGDGTAEEIDADYFTCDGHCSWSPDRKHILYDSYPDAQGWRHLQLYSLADRRGMTLATVRSVRQDRLPVVDIRCDLHPRWSPDGKRISFDSMHEGHRHVYTMEVGEILE